MRAPAAVTLGLLISTTVLAQTTTTLPATVYEQSINLQDASGNLVILDYGALLTSTTVTGRNGTTHNAIARSPKTRLTVVRTSATESVVYDGTLQFIGVGQRAIYALLVTTTAGGTSSASVTRTILAIQTSQSLPAATSGFASYVVTDSPEIRMIAPDVLSLIDGPVSSNSSSTRTATVVNFTGSKFVANQHSIP